MNTNTTAPATVPADVTETIVAAEPAADTAPIEVATAVKRTSKAAGKSKGKGKTVTASAAAETEGDTANAPATKSTWTAEDEKRWNQIQRDRESGKLKGLLIEAVRKHAAAKVEDEDTRWAVVKKASDKTIWEIIQYCDYERGAINMVSRNLSKLAKPAKAEAASVPADAAAV